jgi:hypothetical protein
LTKNIRQNLIVNFNNHEDIIEKKTGKILTKSDTLGGEQGAWSVGHGAWSMELGAWNRQSSGRRAQS